MIKLLSVFQRLIQSMAVRQVLQKLQAWLILCSQKQTTDALSRIFEDFSQLFIAHQGINRQLLLDAFGCNAHMVEGPLTKGTLLVPACHHLRLLLQLWRNFSVKMLRIRILLHCIATFSLPSARKVLKNVSPIWA